MDLEDGSWNNHEASSYQIRVGFAEFYQTVQCVGNGFHRPKRDISIAGCSEGGNVRILGLVQGA